MSTLRRPEELNSMIRHAEHQEQTAQVQWVKAKKKAQAARRQLQELRDYAADYQAQAVNAGNVGDLVNRKQFAGRLEQAIQQQESACQQAEHAVHAYLLRWRKQQQNLKALERLKDERLKAVAQRQARVEQRALDEFALQSLGRNR